MCTYYLLQYLDYRKIKILVLIILLSLATSHIGYWQGSIPNSKSNNSEYEWWLIKPYLSCIVEGLHPINQHKLTHSRLLEWIRLEEKIVNSVWCIFKRSANLCNVMCKHYASNHIRLYLKHPLNCRIFYMLEISLYLQYPKIYFNSLYIVGII